VQTEQGVVKLYGSMRGDQKTTRFGPKKIMIGYESIISSSGHIDSIQVLSWYPACEATDFVDEPTPIAPVIPELKQEEGLENVYVVVPIVVSFFVTIAVCLFY